MRWGALRCERGWDGEGEREARDDFLRLILSLRSVTNYTDPISIAFVPRRVLLCEREILPDALAPKILTLRVFSAVFRCKQNSALETIEKIYCCAFLLSFISFFDTIYRFFNQIFIKLNCVCIVMDIDV